jgi:hypothetical protein
MNPKHKLACCGKMGLSDEMKPVRHANGSRGRNARKAEGKESCRFCCHLCPDLSKSWESSGGHRNDGLRKITQYFLNSIIDPCDPAKHAHDEREKTQPKIASASIKRTKTQTQITEPRGNRYALNVRETERHHTHDAAVHRSEDRRREIWR